MLDYNPFDKPLSDVDTSDIYQLDVPEGYYCEYKRNLIEKSEIAKSIGSFANTYGGFLFLGIDEDNETNRPNNWFTLSSGDSAKYKETVRNTVCEYLNRPPRFSTYSFKGSSQTGDEGYVLMVDVPESRITPHIHNDGCVYRRTGEGNDPYTPLNDPSILDDLHQRKKDWKRRVEEFCQTEIGLTSAYTGDNEYNIQGIPMLEIFGIPTTLDESVCEDVLWDLDGFKQIVQSSELFLIPDDLDSVDDDAKAEMGIDADTYRATSSGAVAQNWVSHDESGDKDSAHTPLTIKFFQDGSAKFFTPVPTIAPENINDYNMSWSTIKDYCDPWPSEIQLVDGQNLVVTIHNLVNMYMNLLLEYDWPIETNEIYLKSRLRNGYRSMLFFDAEWYCDLVRDYGPPICYDQIVESPRGDPLQYNLDVSEEERMGSVLGQMSLILQCFGLPVQETESIVNVLIESILDTNLDSTNGT